MYNMDSQSVATVLSHPLTEAFINLIIFMVLIGFAHLLGSVIGTVLRTVVDSVKRFNKQLKFNREMHNKFNEYNKK